LDENDRALKLAQKTQIDMAKMLGERKEEIDNAKWQIEDLEMVKAELEKELAKKNRHDFRRRTCCSGGIG
jgi:hypothetical protein